MQPLYNTIFSQTSAHFLPHPGENIQKTSRKASNLTGFFDRKGEYKLKSSETLGFPRVFPQSKKKK